MGVRTTVGSIVTRATGAGNRIVYAATYGLIAMQGVVAGAPGRSIMAEAVAMGSPVGQRRNVMSGSSGRVVAVRAIRQVLACVAAG